MTREPFKYEGRITDLIASGKLFGDLGVPELDPKVDRLMLCGGPRSAGRPEGHVDGRRGYDEGAVATPGDYVLEKGLRDLS